MRNAEIPRTGGMRWPPSDEAVSMAAAPGRDRPDAIIAGIVAEPVVAALAAPLPLMAATPKEPSTADWGSACGDRAAMRDAARRIESTAPNARSMLRTRRNEPISVRASWGRRENTPVVVSTVIAVTTRDQSRPGWPNMPGTSQP